MRTIVRPPARLWALALFGALTGSSAWAITPKAAAQAKKVAHAAEVTAFAPVVAELRQIRHLLEVADRDYKGHRAKAVEEISHAIKALPHQHGKRGTSIKGGGEPQALSDAQLREAIKALGAIQAQLAGSSSAHAALAAGHVNTAAKQLEIALTIK
jgi:hypothetical protein